MSATTYDETIPQSCGSQQANLPASLDADKIHPFARVNTILAMARARRPNVKPSTALQEKRLDPDASRSITSSRTPREQSLVSGDLARDPPVQSTKRQLDETPEIDPLPAKRARLTRTNTQPSGVAGKEPEQAAETAPRRLKPTPSKRPYASFNGESGRQPKRARLTRENLHLLDKMGRNNKGTSKASVSIPLGNKSAAESSTKTTSTTTSGFAIQARKNGILEPRYSKPPTNLEDILRQHTGSRETPSPPESIFEHYVDRVGGAVNEATMVWEVGGKLLREYNDKRYKKAFNQAFTGFPKDVGFNNGLSAPQPDFVEGLEMEEFRPFPVDEYINGAILYKDNPGSITLPHLAGEWKGPGKDMLGATLQSSYIGAALVYARDQALSIIRRPDPLGHAEVRTFTTDGTNLNFFAHYAAPSKEDGAIEYHQYQYASANVKDTHQGHKDGRRGLRNQQQHAREQSYALRDRLKEHWKQRRSGFQPFPEDHLPAPVTEPPVARNAYISDDEDGEGCEVVEQPYQPPPPASSKTKRRSNHGIASSSHSASSRSLPPADDYDGLGGSSAQK